MKIFIFNYINELTSSYHSGGGLVIIAKDQEHAKELISTDEYIKVTDSDWEEVKTYDLVGEPEPWIWVMSDAGCC